MKNQDLCMGCMNIMESRELRKCSNCGLMRDSENESLIHLIPGTIFSDKYKVGRAIEQDRSTISYIAYDLSADKKVFIVEYFPRGVVTRLHDSQNITVFNINRKRVFDDGLEYFFDEAARFAGKKDYTNLESVVEIIESNGTGYAVLGIAAGITFEEYLIKQGGNISIVETYEYLIPLIESLSSIHQAGIMHGSISPDSIIINKENTAVLLGLGGIFYNKINNIQMYPENLQPPYTAEEQSADNGAQGPWSDVYSLAAIIFRSVIGTAPPAYRERLESDGLNMFPYIGKELNLSLKDALQKGLAVSPANRYQTAGEFLAALQHKTLMHKVYDNMINKQKKDQLPEGNKRKPRTSGRPGRSKSKHKTDQLPEQHKTDRQLKQDKSKQKTDRLPERDKSNKKSDSLPEGNKKKQKTGRLPEKNTIKKYMPEDENNGHNAADDAVNDNNLKEPQNQKNITNINPLIKPHLKAHSTEPQNRNTHKIYFLAWLSFTIPVMLLIYYFIIN